jgi:hypothetical protein
VHSEKRSVVERSVEKRSTARRRRALPALGAPHPFRCCEASRSTGGAFSSAGDQAMCSEASVQAAASCLKKSSHFVVFASRISISELKAALRTPSAGSPPNTMRGWACVQCHIDSNPPIHSQEFMHIAANPTVNSAQSFSASASQLSRETDPGFLQIKLPCAGYLFTH